MRIPPERPLPESLVRILRDLTVSLGPSTPPWCVIGATARDLRLYHLENIPTGRATNDVDITILASSWDEFDGIKAKLRGSGRFLDAPPEQPHRVVHHATDTPIDVVPYGGIEEGRGRLRWPTRPEVAMSTLGMEEVLRTSTTIEVGDDLAIRIADIPGLVLSKLVAWGDRRAAKDTQDIAALFAAATGTHQSATTSTRPKESRSSRQRATTNYAREPWRG